MMVEVEKSMKKHTITIIILTLLSIFLFQACTNKNDRFRGEIAEPDQIYTITNSDTSRVWNTKELSVNFTYSSSAPNNFNLTGHISISEQITNTFLKIRRLIFLVNFLDSNGEVIYTSYIHPMYSVGMMTPEKIKFNLNSTLPVGAVAFCFSYSGEFRGDGNTRDKKFIGQKSFINNNEPEKTGKTTFQTK